MEEAENKLYPLEGFDGVVADDLLVAAEAKASEHIYLMLRKCRQTLRIGRPENAYVYSDDLIVYVSEIIEMLRSSGSSELLDIMLDLQSLLESRVASLDLSQKWNLRKFRRKSFDDELELGVFWKSRSFDRHEELFTSHLSTDEPIQLLIRGHLWVESALHEYLSRVVPRMDVLNGANFSFSQTLTLCESFGLAGDLINAMRGINKVRNKIAHQLQYSFGDADQRDLINGCSARIRYVAGVDADSVFPDGIANVIATVVLDIHRQIDHGDANRRYLEFLHQETQRVLGDRPADYGG